MRARGPRRKYVAEHFKIPAISTGDIFRANVIQGTPLGVEAKRYMDAGEYVPDEVTNLMVRNRIDEPDAVAGFLLDGYPRTLAQVEELDGHGRVHRPPPRRGRRPDGRREEIVERLLRRAQTEGRADDTEDVIRRRQEVYAEETEPLIASTASVGSPTRWTAWARSTTSPSASSTPSTGSSRADRAAVDLEDLLP